MITWDSLLQNNTLSPVENRVIGGLSLISLHVKLKNPFCFDRFSLDSV